MNLKPFRDIDEHEVLNGLFSTEEANVPKGSFLQIVSFDPDNQNGYGASLAGVPDGAYSSSYEVLAKVKLAAGTGGGAAATGVIGVALCDTVGGFSGTPFVGAKGVVVTNGQLAVSTTTASPNVGTFLSISGADGFALFQVDCI